MLIKKSLLSRHVLLGQGGNFLLFHLLWLAAIFGAVAGSSLWAAAVLVLQIAHGFWVAPMRWDIRMMAVGLLVGVLFEVGLIATGLIEYRLQPTAWMPPVWILVLWLGFAQAFNHSLAWLSRRLVLASVAGAAASAVSLYAGMALGAAQTAAPAALLLLYAFSWSLLVPALAWFAERTRTRDLYARNVSIIYD